ncbi:uncharacterized protein LOC123317436 [Coccinella septempunctata]|uniref:uncharacterized protein LOC123317436 n=1 Tax=Coccinella septempunctata TaxID=41139 RepID=UPI001D06065A|nr:uncharacterized protein LOC123317436 [Coccinella septempunctata]
MSRKSIVFLCFALIVSLASSALIREGRISGFDRLKEPEIDRCLRSKMCPVTLDLRPTCASDGRTYVNLATIHCLNECLKPEEQLTIVSGGYCKDDAPQASSKL